MQSQHANSLLRLKAKKEGGRNIDVVDLVSPEKGRNEKREEIIKKE